MFADVKFRETEMLWLFGIKNAERDRHADEEARLTHGAFQCDDVSALLKHSVIPEQTIRMPKVSSGALDRLEKSTRFQRMQVIRRDIYFRIIHIDIITFF
jgi:hypothetical protein